MDAVLTAFVVVFIAEMGDKSQLLALAAATRLRAAHVVTAVLIAGVVSQGFAAAVGGLLGSLVHGPVVGLAGAVLFLGCAVLALRDTSGEERFSVPEGVSAVQVVGGLALALAVAELGDKTMFATAALAARDGVLRVWLGSAMGMAAAGLIGVAAGRVLGSRLPERPLRVLAALVFAGAGVWMAFDSLS